MRERRLIAAQAGLWTWLNWARRRPRLTLAAWVAAAAASIALAIAQLSVNTDAGDMIARDVDYRRDQAVFEATFPRLQDQVLVLVRASTEDGADVFARALRSELLQRSEAVRGVYAPEIDPFFERNGLLYLEFDALERLLDRLNRAAPLIERLVASPSLPVLFDALAEGLERAEEGGDRAAMARVSDELAAVINARLDGSPRGFSWLGAFEDADSDALTQRLLVVEPNLAFDALAPARRVRDAVMDAEAAAAAATGVSPQIYLTGDPILRSEELRSVAEGVGAAFMLSFLGVGAVLLVGLRSARVALATVAAVVISIALTAGFATLTVGALNLVSIAFAVLMLGLGVDFAIHLVLHVQADRLRGVSARPALYRAAREIGVAFVIAAVTTAMAFLAFAPTQFAGMAQLGIIAAAGVLIAFAATTSILGATLSLLPPPRPATRGLHAPAPEAAAARRRVFAWGLLALGLVAVALTPFARFDADPMALRDPDAASVQAFERLFDDDRVQPYRLSALAPDLAAADALAARLAAVPAVDSARTLSDFLPQDAAAKADLIAFAAFGIESALSPPPTEPPDAGPANARLASALAVADGAAFGRLAEALGRLDAEGPAMREALEADVFRFWDAQLTRLRAQLYPEPVSLETLPGSLRERYLADDGRARIEISPVEDLRDPAARRAFVEAVVAESPDASGPARTVMEAGGVVSRAMLIAVALAGFAVAVIVYVALRDAAVTALILVTLALAGALTTATGVLIGMPFNFANVIVLPLLIGLGVDSAIHLALRARGVARAAGVYDTTTPRAVVFSAMTTIASFASLAVSPHQGTASMGVLLTIALFWTSTCTIVLLPFLMERIGASRAAQTPALDTEERRQDASLPS